MIDIVNKIIAIILVILGLIHYIVWSLSKDDYYYKQAVWFIVLTIANIIV